MKKIILLTLLSSLLLAGTQIQAQEKWDLRRCVEYAVANNIDVRQATIQAKGSHLTLEQSKLQRWPTANFQNSNGFQFGRSIDPATNGFTNQQITFSQFGLSSGVTLFNFNSQKNTILGNEFEAKAQDAAVESWKNDISLNIAGAYLTALLSREQVNIALVQINQTREQLINTRKLVDAGSLPELNAAELEAQLARDSSTYIAAFTQFQTNLLSLKSFMNLDPSVPFELDTPPIDRIPVETFADLRPEPVYTQALANMPLQKVNKLRLQALEKFQKAARGNMYPSIGAFANVNSAYSSALKNLPKGANIPVTIPIGFTTMGSAQNPDVFTQTFIPSGSQKADFIRQLDFNFRQSVGISLTVPIFNGGQARTAWQRSKLNYQNQQLQIEKSDQKLKQDIYLAYNNATSAFQRYQASIKSVQTAEYSYELSKKRYEAGLSRTIDLITNQNNLFRARLERISNQFEYVFRMKVLEFYKGQGIKL
ncbi:TolC family protein [Lacibacter sp. H375]|uniref:TolC family protein n=1 Tax=Lacibacter sp. H375 TaxID=3133424 RepID=UPI0030BB9C75